MKLPKMSNMKIDKKGTAQMREAFSKNKKVRVTINFDADILESVRKMAEEMGSPYQTLLNKIVRDAVIKKSKEESRIDHIEEEIHKLKKKLAA